MRRIIILMTLVLGIIVSQLAIMNVALAKAEKPNVAVVMILNDKVDIDIKNFFRHNKKHLGNKNVKMISDKDVQNKYANYCSKNNISGNRLPNEQALINFVSYGNYDKVIYLFIKEANATFIKDEAVMMMNGTTTPKMTGVPKTYYITRYYFDTSATIEAILVDKNGIIKRTNFTKDIKNFTNESYVAVDKEATGIEAKNLACRESITSIGKVLKPLI